MEEPVFLLMDIILSMRCGNLIYMPSICAKLLQDKKGEIIRNFLLCLFVSDMEEDHILKMCVGDTKEMAHTPRVQG